MSSGDFPKIHNGAKARKSDGNLTYTYIDSYGDVITETKPQLEPDAIAEMTIDRMERFKSAGPGSRESEISRAERKYISAHDESVLRAAWNKLDDHGKMEFDMMLSEKSHHGISDSRWADNNTKEREEIVGDNQVPL
jgi:4-alpha-glucanotransferase